MRDLTPRLDGFSDPSVDPASVDRGRVSNSFSANSEDGRTFYFVADAAYPTAPNSEGELPASGSDNLYMAKLGEGIDDPVELRFIAATGSGASYASPDGSVLAFSSAGNLVSGRTTGGDAQVYVYDAKANSLDCASCPADGTLPSGPANTSQFLAALGGTYSTWRNDKGYKRLVSSDGAVFFDTPTSLLPGDQNVGVSDVYEYRGGQLRLISSGTSSPPSELRAVSRSGNDVFFATTDALSSGDKEPGALKLYDARVGGGCEGSLAGGAACPPLPEPPCDVNAGACEGPGTSAANQPGAGSAAFSGPGNPEPTPRANPCAKPARKAKALSRRAKRLARSAGRVSRKNHRRAVRMRRKAHRLAGHARGLSKRAKRCRVARKGKRANNNRRAGR